MAPRPARPILRWAAKLLLALVLGALCFEGAVRFLLFSDMASSWGIAQRLRKPSRFSNYIEDEFWILQHRFLDPECVEGPSGYDEQLGWVGSYIAPGTYRRLDEPPSSERQLILLYGDSFAQCTVSTDDCFQGLVERSRLGERFALLNFGVGGYGLDQIYMLLQRTIDAYAKRKPFVLVGLLVDGDLDRCLLTLYGCSKPRLVIEDGRLRPEQQRVPTCREYLDRTPFRFPSLAARLLIYDTDFLPLELRAKVSRQEQKFDDRIALTQKLLEQIHLELEQRSLCHAFVLFYTERAVRYPSVEQDMDQLVRTTLDSLGAPWLDMREALLEDSRRSGRPITAYYDQLQPPMGHPTLEGNQAMLAAMIAGLGRHCGLDQGQLPLSAGQIAQVELRGVGAVARFSEKTRSPFPGGTDTRRVILRVGSEGPTEIHYDLTGGVKTFACTVRTTPFAGESNAGSAMRLRALADGEEIFSRTLAQAEEPFDLALDLDGRHRLVLCLDDQGGGWENDAIVLCDPEFR